ncbi:metallophosphoesterase family protein [Oceanobacillus bengalensis]|uniref:Phosphoesterase n=1 Tax=Oceanobacillus bengalensis TaxID=1435466 RepID=A0A494Z5Y6_9BACI|nr:metallophosphoesterase [Oceanobacillus bengalensis]RKQ17962.1 metallophosphoesterase [Oceanobacillus bengalensis]
MSKVLIVSDSHGLTEELSAIKARHQISNLIHCGDSELDFNTDELEGFYKVRGNCDMDSMFPNEEVITIDGLTFFVTHGHLYNVKMNLMKLSYRAEEVGANVICFGHTHIAGAEKIDRQLFINPGSIRLPRNRPEPTYAVMEWETVQSISVQFYTVDGQLVQDMNFQGSL